MFYMLFSTWSSWQTTESVWNRIVTSTEPAAVGETYRVLLVKLCRYSVESCWCVCVSLCLGGMEQTELQVGVEGWRKEDLCPSHHTCLHGKICLHKSCSAQALTFAEPRLCKRVRVEIIRLSTTKHMTSCENSCCCTPTLVFFLNAHSPTYLWALLGMKGMKSNAHTHTHTPQQPFLSVPLPFITDQSTYSSSSIGAGCGLSLCCIIWLCTACVGILRPYRNIKRSCWVKGLLLCVGICFRTVIYTFTLLLLTKHVYL